MAIISFWNNEIRETGKSSAIAAISTYLGVNHNYKVLVIDTKFRDTFYKDCFFKDDKGIEMVKNTNNAKTDIGHGISGLSKAVLSNKTAPEIVTNYTKLVFKDRLELLMDTKIEAEEYDIYKKIFKNIALMANKYYDLVFIDLDKSVGEKIENELLSLSDIIIACLPQKPKSIENYLIAKEEKEILKEKAVIPLIGRYDKHSKYSTKNVGRYLREKNGIITIPYNTLFFEACNEGTVADYFIKFRRIDSKDRNAVFISNVKDATEKIVFRLQELQMRM